MALYRVIEFIQQPGGGVHSEYHMIAAASLAEACRNWNSDTQRKPHELMFITAQAFADRSPTVCQNFTNWKPIVMSDEQFEVWLRVNEGVLFLRLADAMMVIDDDAYDIRIARQNTEFDAVRDLSEQYRRITLTPVVDDDYPSVRHDYERAVAVTLDAFRQNGRIK